MPGAAAFGFKAAGFDFSFLLLPLIFTLTRIAVVVQYLC
jgi:hypothetical protein